MAGGVVIVIIINMTLLVIITALLLVGGIVVGAEGGFGAFGRGKALGMREILCLARCHHLD